ncbi:MAG: hypothetical protein ACR2GP_15265 [Burkholderiaceae bacterium]
MRRCSIARRRTDQRALALIDSYGTFEAADPQFHALLALEWPQFDAAHLPPAAVAAMAAGKAFNGRAIEIAFRSLGSRIVCQARTGGSSARLSERERLVAQHFATGKSHKKSRACWAHRPTPSCAVEQVYRKLGVRDKVSLARRLSRDD